jgi:predicted permease
MTWWHRVRHRWRLEDELDAELRFHFDRLVADHVAAGMTEREARQRARADFGGIEGIKDDCRQARGTRWLHDISSDLRFAARLLASDRGTTATAILVLALGLGVHTTFFSIVNAMCLRGLPIRDVSRIVDIAVHDSAHGRQLLSLSQVDRLQAATPPAVEGVGAYVSRPATLRDGDRAADRVAIAYVSWNAFGLIRQPPLLGRDFRPDEDRRGDAPVAILGADLWRTRFSSNPEILGEQVIINGEAASIVGVMPDGVRFPGNADVWQPLSTIALPSDAQVLSAYGRLADGASIGRARDSLDAVLRTDGRAPAHDTARVEVVPINDRYRASMTDPAWLAFLTAGFLVLAIACSNVASLLLARGARRRREIAVRLSLGATRGRIVRQLLVEAAMLAGMGGVLALAIAALGLSLFTKAIPQAILPDWMMPSFDGRVVAVLAVVCAGAGVLAGLAPALQLARTRLNGTLQTTNPGASRGPAGARWSNVLLTVQLALTVVLLCSVGITVQGFYVLQHDGPSIDESRLLTATIALPQEKYAAPELRRDFFQQLGARIVGPRRATALSVASAAMGSGEMRKVAIGGQDPSTSTTVVRTIAVDASYFDALGLRLVAGRAFTSDETDDARPVVVVNQRFAEMYFPPGHAVGERLRLISVSGASSATDEPRTVVGIAPSMRDQPALAPEPLVYVPLPETGLLTATLLLRTDGSPAALAPLVREEMRRIDPDVPLSRLMPLADATREGRWQARVSAGLISSIAFIALILATAGLAALTAQSVAERGRELGIRIALGARQGQIVGLVIRRVLLQIAVGLMFGAIGAKAWERLFATAGLTTPGNLTAVAVLVTLVTLAVAAFPARRAARIDPVVILRAE